MRRLADLHRDGWGSLQALDTYSEQSTYARGIYRRPTNRQMLRFLAKTYATAFRQKLLSPLDEKWVLAFRRRGSDDRFTIVHPPADRFYADPFLAEHDGRTFVFFEDYSYGTAKAPSPSPSCARTAWASHRPSSPVRITCPIPRCSSGGASGSCCRKPARDGAWRFGARDGSPTNGRSKPSPWTASMPATRRYGEQRRAVVDVRHALRRRRPARR